MRRIGERAGRTGIEAAADREQQGHSGYGLAGLDVHHGLARGEYLGLRVEHGQIARQSGPVTLLGQLVGGFGGIERLLLIEPLALQGVQARDLIGGLLHGAKDCVVVAGDRRIELRLAPTVLRAQTATVEQRQRDERTGTVSPGARLHKIMHAERAEACQRAQTHTRIERRFGSEALCIGGFHGQA